MVSICGHQLICPKGQQLSGYDKFPTNHKKQNEFAHNHRSFYSVPIALVGVATSHLPMPSTCQCKVFASLVVDDFTAMTGCLSQKKGSPEMKNLKNRDWTKGDCLQIEVKSSSPNRFVEYFS